VSLTVNHSVDTLKICDLILIQILRFLYLKTDSNHKMNSGAAKLLRQIIRIVCQIFRRKEQNSEFKMTIKSKVTWPNGTVREDETTLFFPTLDDMMTAANHRSEGAAIPLEIMEIEG